MGLGKSVRRRWRRWISSIAPGIIMAKTIKVWSGTEWVNVGILSAIPTDYVTQADLIHRKKYV